MKSPRRMKPKMQVETPPSDPSSHEAIATLAYSYWEADGRPEGAGLEYWLRAERETLDQHSLPSPDEERGGE